VQCRRNDDWLVLVHQSIGQPHDRNDKIGRPRGQRNPYDGLFIPNFVCLGDCHDRGYHCSHENEFVQHRFPVYGMGEWFMGLMQSLPLTLMVHGVMGHNFIRKNGIIRVLYSEYRYSLIPFFKSFFSFSVRGSLFS
jgi:hypothetical protein